YPDLYVCNWFAPDVFYHNKEGKRFEVVDLALPHLQDSLNSNGVSFGDFDNDGDLDLLVTDRHGGSRLYRNNTSSTQSDWQFTDITDSAGIENQNAAYGSVIADFNNDGWQDIFFTNIGPNLLYLNTRPGNFQLAYREKIPRQSSLRHYSTGTAVADYDNDGDLDLFVANKDTHSVMYQNPLNSDKSIRLRVEGVHSNRDAIGTKIWLYKENGKNKSTNLAGYREVSGGSGYLSLSEPWVHFGTGESSETYSARIRFPSGEEIRLEDLQPGKTYYVVETGGIQKTAIRVFQQVYRIVRGKYFWLNFFLFLLMVGIISSFIAFSIRRYRWQNKQTALFLISMLVLLYTLFLLLSGSKLQNILLLQIAAMTVVMAIITGFMEKIYRIETQRFGHRLLLQNFSQQLIFIKNNDELYQQMVSTIRQSMNVEFCSSFEVENTSAHFKAADGKWNSENQKLTLADATRNEFLQSRLLQISSLQNPPPELSTTATQLLIPLSRKEKLFAVLLLGERKDGNDFRSEDLAVLQILAGQAAIAIENNLYIEESKKLIQKLTEAELREKYVKELEAQNKRLEQLYSELRETQTQLIQSEKMASLGQLVAGVAHELNNPISFVYANMKELQQYSEAITELLQLLTDGANLKEFEAKLQEKLDELDQKYDLAFIQQDINELIDESLQGSRRVKDVVQNLRKFSRLDEADLKAVDLHEGLESTLLLLNNELKNRIAVHKDYGELPQVTCNAGQINQVFMNLLMNAAQAIDDKGDIWISTRRSNSHVEVKIRDNGKGISRDIQNKIFDPFFTTKPVGKGTGLGLSISYNIIQNHGGQIMAESNEGEGTCFTITLPIEPPNKNNQ
ncbi:MAG: GAF domain-containing protein, partial [Aliifodinibius sp.]|nr:GAF domain-containing protein [Fodinibius sp.]